MKLSYLLNKGLEHLVKYGDCDVKINLLTENQSNFLLDESIHICDYNKDFELEIDVETKEKLINKIK